MIISDKFQYFLMFYFMFFYLELYVWDQIFKIEVPYSIGAVRWSAKHSTLFFCFFVFFFFDPQKTILGLEKLEKILRK